MNNMKHLLALIFCLSIAAATGTTRGAIVSSSVEPGAYSEYAIQGPYAGLASEDGAILSWDNLLIFGNPEHVYADLLWFTSGYMTWEHSVPIPGDAHVDSLTYVVEVSSEFPSANFVWPSDLTVSVNGVAIGIWTIPGDPDAAYGFASMPNHLASHISQYGWLTKWTVDSTGTYFEAEFRDIPNFGYDSISKAQISSVTLADLNLVIGQPIAITLSVPGTSGLNVYGDTWGDYPFDPTVTIQYHESPIELDEYPPTIGVHQILSGPPTQLILRAADVDSGLASIQVISAINADIVIPPFNQGTTEPVYPVATKIDQTKGARVALRVTDVVGNVIEGDPVVTTMELVKGGWLAQRFTEIPKAESYITVQNGAEGFKKLIIRMNEMTWMLHPKDNETSFLDVSAAMLDIDNNIVDLVGHGPPGANALIVIADSPQTPFVDGETDATGPQGKTKRANRVWGRLAAEINLEP